MPERPAGRAPAVPAGGRADAGVRHHGPRQPGARLAVHGRRLLCRHLHGTHRLLPRRRRPGARRHAPRRHGGGGDRHAPALRARSPRPCARHLRADPVLQRAGAARLGAGRQDAAAAVLAQPLDRDPARRALLHVPAVHHRGGAGGGARALCRHHAHALRHAGARRRLQPRDGGRARHQHQAALHLRVRRRRGACRARRHDAGRHPHRPDRHGREHSRSWRSW